MQGQYRFIYKAIHERLIVGETEIEISAAKATLQNLLHSASGKEKLRKQYQVKKRKVTLFRRWNIELYRDLYKEKIKMQYLYVLMIDSLHYFVYNYASLGWNDINLWFSLKKKKKINAARVLPHWTHIFESFILAHRFFRNNFQTLSPNKHVLTVNFLWVIRNTTSFLKSQLVFIYVLTFPISNTL